MGCSRIVHYTLVLLALLCCIDGASLAVNNGAPPADNDTRFDAIAAFSESSALFDLPPGAAGDYWGNGTLIDSTHMLMARHIAPTLPSNTVTLADEGKYAFRFRRRIDGGLGTAEAGWETFFHMTVHSFQTFGENVDMVIAELDEAVAHINPIPIDPDFQVAANMTLTLAGWGKEGPCFNEGPKRRLNLINAACSFVNCGVILWESGPVNIFDSGGAILYEIPSGRIRLVGVIDWLWGGTDARMALDPPYDPGCFDGRTIGGGDPTCADFNGDGHTDVNDILWVINNWGPCPPEVHCHDVDGDHAIGVGELLNVINAWGIDCPMPCPFDLNLDGVVDALDLQIVINHSNIPCCSVNCPWDFDDDGDVDENDQAILENNYGPCP